MHPLLLTASLVLGQAWEPTAMVLTSKGAVVLERGQERQRAGAMTLLSGGDRLQLPEGAEVTALFLADGRRERVKGKLLATIGVKGFEPADKAERVDAAKLTRGSLQCLRDLARSARGGVGVLRSDERPGTPAVITPMYGATVLTDRPELSWPAQKDADGYLVQLLNGLEGRDQRKLWEAKAKEPKLAYPEKEKPLAIGLRYHWRVYPLKGDERGEPIVASKFAVLTESELKTLETAQALRDSRFAADLLLAATLYEAHGTYDEALRLYERLAEMSPSEAGFHTALASYYDRAGRRDLATKARWRAAAARGSGAR